MQPAGQIAQLQAVIAAQQAQIIVLSARKVPRAWADTISAIALIISILAFIGQGGANIAIIKGHLARAQEMAKVQLSNIHSGVTSGVQRMAAARAGPSAPTFPAGAGTAPNFAAAAAASAPTTSAPKPVATEQTSLLAKEPKSDDPVV